MAELSERHEVRVRGKDNTVVFLVRDTSLADVAKCALISCDSNMRSNVSVGPPIDLLIYRRNSLAKPFVTRLEAGHPYLQANPRGLGRRHPQSVPAISHYPGWSF